MEPDNKEEFISAIVQDILCESINQKSKFFLPRKPLKSEEIEYTTSEEAMTHLLSTFLNQIYSELTGRSKSEHKFIKKL